MSMIPIAKYVVPSSPAVAGFSFTNIPQTFTHLQLRGSFQRSNAGFFSNDTRLGFNTDGYPSTNYVSHTLAGDGSSASSAYYNARDWIFTGYIYPYSPSSYQSYFNTMIVDILDYTNTNKYKTVRSLSGYDYNGQGVVSLNSGLWMSTAAINAVSWFTGNGSTTDFPLTPGSVFTLYGITDSPATGA